MKETHDAGQKLAFRVSCCRPGLNEILYPTWLEAIGGRIIQGDHDGRGPFPVPDLDDPIVLERHLDFIKRLGARYDGHPDIDHVDLGSVGWWGEWHMSGSKNVKMPTLETRKKIVDAYLAAFKKTPLVMLIGGGEMSEARRPSTAPAGGPIAWATWADSPRPGATCARATRSWIKEAGIAGRLEDGPRRLGNVLGHAEMGERGLVAALHLQLRPGLHGSYHQQQIGTAARRRENVRPEIERFLRRLGYRLVLKELEHPAQVKAG